MALSRHRISAFLGDTTLVFALVIKLLLTDPRGTLLTWNDDYIRIPVLRALPSRIGRRRENGAPPTNYDQRINGWKRAMEVTQQQGLMAFQPLINEMSNGSTGALPPHSLATGPLDDEHRRKRLYSSDL